jgi:hypothetical protein
VGVVVDEFCYRLGFWRGTGFGGEARGLVDNAGDDLQVVQEFAGALVVEVVGGDAAEDLGGDGECGGKVFDDGEFEGLVGVEVAEFAGRGFGAAGGVVVVAELLVAEGGRAALVSFGVDVAALVAFLGDGDGNGLLWHGGTPYGRFSTKITDLNGLDHDPGVDAKGTGRGRMCRQDEMTRLYAGRFGLRFAFVLPGLAGSRSGPESLGTTLGILCPFS